MTKKFIITILSVSLIVVMLVPSNAVIFAETDTTDSDIQSAYFKKILQQKSIQDMTELQKEKFTHQVKDYFNSTPYHKQIFVLIEELAEIESQIKETKDNGKDTTKLTQKLWVTIYNLENYGVVSEERLTSNPEYWMDRASNAMKQVSQGSAVQASIGNTEHHNINSSSRCN